MSSPVGGAGGFTRARRTNGLLAVNLLLAKARAPAGSGCSGLEEHREQMRLLGAWDQPVSAAYPSDRDHRSGRLESRVGARAERSSHHGAAGRHRDLVEAGRPDRDTGHSPPDGRPTCALLDPRRLRRGGYRGYARDVRPDGGRHGEDRKSTRLNSSHTVISYAVFCLKKKKLRLPQESLHKQHKYNKQNDSR